MTNSPLALLSKISRRPYLYRGINERLAAASVANQADYQLWLEAGNRSDDKIYLGVKLDPFLALNIAVGIAVSGSADSEEYIFYRSFEDNTPVNQVNHLAYQMAMTIYSTFSYNLDQPALVVGRLES